MLIGVIKPMSGLPDKLISFFLATEPITMIFVIAFAAFGVVSFSLYVVVLALKQKRGE